MSTKEYDPFDYWTERTDWGTKSPKFLKRDKLVEGLDQATVTWVRTQLQARQNPSLLDIGCGFGRWAEVLEGYYSKFVGVDVVQARVEAAQTDWGRPNRGFQVIPTVGDWTLEMTFDVILFITVIQHLPLDMTVAILKSATRHLAPGGVMLLVEWQLQDVEETDIQDSGTSHMIAKSIRQISREVPDLVWSGHAGRYILSRRQEK